MSETKSAAEVWVDKKRWLWMWGPGLPVVCIISFVLWIQFDWLPFLALAPLLFFVLVPLIDVIMPTDTSSPPEAVIEALENDRYYRWLTYVFLPVQYIGFVGAMLMVGGVNVVHLLTELGGVTGWFQDHGMTQLVRADPAMSLSERFAATISAGTLGGLAINCAHELGHKKESAERWLARITLAQVCYGHFYIEHNRGHHVRVATPEDPASARMGETFWEFFPRSVAGSLKSAWGLEAKRLRRVGKPVFHPSNDVLNAWAMSVALFAGLVWWAGLDLLPFLLFQAVWGFWMLEMVNYLEHYGMLRQKLEGGRFERVAPRHSWNSNNLATNVILYHLQRHSDHHANPTRRYQALRDIKEAPVLPTGYAGTIELAMFPPLWRRVMDKRVLEHYDGDISQVNLHPRVRDSYLRKYAVVQESSAG